MQKQNETQVLTTQELIKTGVVVDGQTFVNMTPHNLVWYHNQTEKITIPPSGQSVRVGQTHPTFDGTFSTSSFNGELVGMPNESVEGVVWIVSLPTKLQMPKRLDVVCGMTNHELTERDKFVKSVPGWIREIV